MLWMDPLAGTVVIANSPFGLVRDTGGIPLDRTPDARIAKGPRNHRMRSDQDDKSAPVASAASEKAVVMI